MQARHRAKSTPVKSVMNVQASGLPVVLFAGLCNLASRLIRRMDIPMRRSKFHPPGWNEEIVATSEIFDSIDEL